MLLDTNACIVGGLIGAALGVENIPDNLKTVSIIRFLKKNLSS